MSWSRTRQSCLPLQWLELSRAAWSMTSWWEDSSGGNTKWRFLTLEKSYPTYAGAVAETRRTSTKIRTLRWFRRRCKVRRCKTQARTDPWRLARVVVWQGIAYLLWCNLPFRNAWPLFNFLRDATKKEEDFLEIFPKCRPPPPLSSFWEPLFPKKSIVYFAF